MLKLGLRGLVIHYPIPCVLQLIDVCTFSVLVERQSDFHGCSDTVMKLRPLKDVFTLIIFEFDLEFALSHGSKSSLIDFRYLESFSRQILDCTKLKCTPPDTLG